MLLPASASCKGKGAPLKTTKGGAPGQARATQEEHDKSERYIFAFHFVYSILEGDRAREESVRRLVR
jgi:hypothetical protein